MIVSTMQPKRCLEKIADSLDSQTSDLDSEILDIEIPQEEPDTEPEPEPDPEFRIHRNLEAILAKRAKLDN